MQVMANAYSRVLFRTFYRCGKRTMRIEVKAGTKSQVILEYTLLFLFIMSGVNRVNEMKSMV